ncbi:hypothetical protein D3C81_10400 [compost metagenome]
MRLKKLLIAIGVGVVLSFSYNLKVQAAQIDDSVPSGAYFFSRDNVLASSGGAEDSALFSQVLEGKQGAVVDEMLKLSENKFTSTTINGDLESTGVNAWTEDLNSLYNNTEGTTFTMRRGATEYKIYVPRGVRFFDRGDGIGRNIAVNRAVIGYSISAITRYKNAIKEGILAGNIAAGYNIYSVYSDNQYPLSDILVEAKDKDGKELGYKTIGTDKQGVNYGLDYFYSPLFGKMSVADVPSSDDAWRAKLDSVAVTGGPTLNFAANDDFRNFVSNKDTTMETMAVIDASKVTGANGIQKYKCRESSKTVEPQNMLDMGMRVITPKTFAKRDDGKYMIKYASGFNQIPNVKLSIGRKYVYSVDADNKLSRIGEYSAFDIDDNSLVLYFTLVGDKKVGAVVPLWYKESVMDTVSSKELYITGREIRFNNAYSGQIDLNGENKDLLSVNTKSDGGYGIMLRKFAFTAGADYKSKADHYDVGVGIDEFQLATDFLIPTNSADKEKPRGFVMVRNNFFIEDKDLLTWLQSSTAAAMKEVKAKTLYDLISGAFDLKETQLTYEQYKRMEEIKSELNKGLKGYLLSAVRIIVMIFGVFLSIYGVALIFAYFIDIFNTIIDFSLVEKMSFKKLYPVTSRDEVGYSEVNGVKYVTLKDILIRGFIIAFIGGFFIMSTPVIELLFTLYVKVTTITGGI